MTSELILAAIAVSAFLLVAARAYDRYRAGRIARLRTLGDEFYSAAGRLLANPEVNLEAVTLLDFVALSVANPMLAWSWLNTLNRRPHRPTSASQPLPYMAKSVTDEFVAATIAGLLFIAELHPVPGYRIRRHVQRLQRRNSADPEKVQKAAKAIERFAYIEMPAARRGRHSAPAPLAR